MHAPVLAYHGTRLRRPRITLGGGESMENDARAHPRRQETTSKHAPAHSSSPVESYSVELDGLAVPPAHAVLHLDARGL